MSEKEVPLLSTSEHEAVVDPLSTTQFYVNQTEADQEGASNSGSWKGYKDVLFLFLFLVNLVILAGIAVTYGGVSLVNSHAEYWVVNTNGTEQIDHTKDNIPLKFLTGLIFIVLASSLVSIAWIYVLSNIASMFMNFVIISMTAGTALSGFVVLFLGYPYFAFALMVMALVILGLSYLYQNRLEFASMNLQVACKAILAVPSTIKYSLYLTMMQGLFLILWAIAAVGFATNSYHITKTYNGKTYNLDQCSTYRYSSSFEVDGNSLTCTSGTCYSCLCDGTVVSSSPCFTPKLYYATFTFLVLSLFWVCAVISNIVHCTTSSAVYAWWKTGQCSEEALQASFDRMTSTSLGSICFGSLLTAIIRTIRSFLHFLAVRMKNQNSNNSQSSARDTGTVLAHLNRMSLGLLVRCTEALDRMILYFNRYAFCFVALYGMSYLDAAKAAVELFKARGLTTLFNDDLIDLVILISQVMVSIFSLILAYLYARSTGITGAYLYLFETCAMTTGFVMSVVILSTIQSAVTTVYVSFAKNPMVFEAVHPTLYASLANTWVKIFPGCLALSETRNLQPKSTTTQRPFVTDLNQQGHGQTFRGSYHPPAMNSHQSHSETGSSSGSSSVPSSLYSSVMRMVQPATVRGGYQQVPTSEYQQGEAETLNRSGLRIAGPWGTSTTSAVTTLGLAIKDLAKDPFGLKPVPAPMKSGGASLEESFSI